MKIANFKFALGLICLQLALSITTSAQDEVRAAWQIAKFDITVAAPGTDRALSAQATLLARNVGGAAGSTLSLRINSKAEVKSVTVGSATATFNSRPETRGNAQRITITLPSSVSSGGSVTVTVDYKLTVTENTGVAAISSMRSTARACSIIAITITFSSAEL